MLLGPIEDAPVEEWDRMVTLNVQGVLYCAHAALKHLLAAADDEPRHVADLVNISSVAGRVARQGSGVYNATKWGVNAFTESLRQEVTGRHVRVSVVEPGAVATELVSHNRDEVIETIKDRFGDIERLEADDIADAIEYVVTRPRHVAVNELLVRPTEQTGWPDAGQPDVQEVLPGLDPGGLTPDAAAADSRSGPSQRCRLGPALADAHLSENVAGGDSRVAARRDPGPGSRPEPDLP